MKKKVMTLCLLQKGPRLLLGMKKIGFGKGKWNGFGGKVENGENIEIAAKREVYEEAGIEVKKIEKMGVVDFEFRGQPEILEVHIFRANGFSGQPAETEEMRPKWFDTSKIPFDEMWADDRHWLPLLLEGKRFRGRFLFDGEDRILNYELSEVPVHTY